MITNPAATITKAASKQTYYTILLLVDRGRVDDAMQAYAYFRWLDDVLDSDSGSRTERISLLERQKSLLEKCYLGYTLGDINDQEQMLVKLIQRDHEENSGLQSFLRNMMQVLDFDAKRRGRLISNVELTQYTHSLAVAVTDVLHHFIGHVQPSSNNGARYMAATGAHITHLLRDTLEDIQAGYFNIPQEYLTAKGISPQDVESEYYRDWIRERSSQARACFQSGKEYLAQVESVRCRIAGYAYIAPFELVLEALERSDYRLTSKYPMGTGLGAAMRMSGSVLSFAFPPPMYTRERDKPRKLEIVQGQSTRKWKWRTKS